MQQKQTRVPGIFFSIFSRRDLFTTLSNLKLQVFFFTLKVSWSGASLPRDGPRRLHVPRNRCLFIYLLSPEMAGCQRGFGWSSSGGDAMEEFSVKTVPGLRRSCVDRGDFLSLKPPWESGTWPFQTSLEGNKGLLFNTHFPPDEQWWCLDTHQQATFWSQLSLVRLVTESLRIVH